MAAFLFWSVHQRSHVDLERTTAAGRMAKSTADGRPFRLVAMARGAAGLLLRRSFQPTDGSRLCWCAAKLAPAISHQGFIPALIVIDKQYARYS